MIRAIVSDRRAWVQAGIGDSCNLRDEKLRVSAQLGKVIGIGTNYGRTRWTLGSGGPCWPLGSSLALRPLDSRWPCSSSRSLRSSRPRRPWNRRCGSSDSSWPLWPRTTLWPHCPWWPLNTLRSSRSYRPRIAFRPYRPHFCRLGLRPDPHTSRDRSGWGYSHPRPWHRPIARS